MKLREMMGCLLGSAVVYVAMAACSGNDNLPAGVANGHGGGSGSSGIGQGGGATTSGGMWDAMTDPVPNASADPKSGSRLKAKYRTGSDGSKAYIPSLWYDSDRKEDCSFAMAGDGVERCLPSGLSVIAFSDAQCTQPLAMDNTGCAAKYGIQRDKPSGCSSTGAARIFELGAQASIGTIYLQAGTQCISTQAPSGATLYPVGAEVPPTAFVQGTVQSDP